MAEPAIILFEQFQRATTTNEISSCNWVGYTTSPQLTNIRVELQTLAVSATNSFQAAASATEASLTSISASCANALSYLGTTSASLISNISSTSAASINVVVSQFNLLSSQLDIIELKHTNYITQLSSDLTYIDNVYTLISNSNAFNLSSILATISASLPVDQSRVITLSTSIFNAEQNTFNADTIISNISATVVALEPITPKFVSGNIYLSARSPGETLIFSGSDSKITITPGLTANARFGILAETDGTDITIVPSGVTLNANNLSELTIRTKLSNKVILFHTTSDNWWVFGGLES